MCPRSMSLQGTDEAVAVYSVVGLLQVKKYQEEGILVVSGKHLGELDLHGCCNRASTRAELVEGIVKLDAGPETGIYDGLHNPP